MPEIPHSLFVSSLHLLKIACRQLKEPPVARAAQPAPRFPPCFAHILASGLYHLPDAVTDPQKQGGDE